VGSIEIVLSMLLAVITSSYLVRALPFSVPLPLVQIALGAVIAGISAHGVMLDPDIFFLLFLPPLLFLDGWRIPKNGLFRDKATILQLALGLVVFTVAGIGLMTHWLIPAMPLPVAFALAAILAPTDPVAVSSIAARVPIPKRMMHILEGESLLNDATGLVCFRFAVAAALTGGFSIASASVTFLWLALGGLGIGMGVTFAITASQRWLSRHVGEESGSQILISLLTPFGAYLLAERLHASGILAAVAAGITMSHVELSGRALASTRLRRAAVWNAVQFTLNGIMFVLLGEQLPEILKGATDSVTQSGHGNTWWLAAYALALTAGLVVLRLIWVWTSLSLTIYRAQRRGEPVVKPPQRLVLAMSLAGVRGAITLAGVLTLPVLMPDGMAFPARDLAIFLATSVILLSLILATIALPRLLKDLSFPQESPAQQEEDYARHEAALAALHAVEQTQQQLRPNADDAEVYAQAAAPILSLYRQRLAGDHLSERTGAKQVCMAHEAERVIRLTGFQAERKVIFALAREGTISDEIARKLVREIDLLESRYR
jgi:Na+/H+ antiporter